MADEPPAWFQTVRNGNVATVTLRALGPDILGAPQAMVTTVAHAAAMNGRVEILQCLYELVPDTLSAQDNNGLTPVP